MYSSSCSCLPNKNQQYFPGSISQNLDILRTFTTKSFSSNLEENPGTMHLPANIISNSLATVSNSRPSDLPNLPTKKSNIMQFAYNLQDTTMKFKTKNESNFPSLERTRSSCKNYFPQYDCIATMPFVSSHLVGGFVGSKSQLGRRPSSHGIGVNMWDIVREFIEYFGNSKSFPEKRESQKTSMSERKCTSIEKDSSNMSAEQSLDTTDPHIHINESSVIAYTVIGKNCVSAPKQSYADVAKTSIGNPAKIGDDERSEQRLRYPQSKPKMIYENSVLLNRDRIASECSTDSDDSFIVFECCDVDDESEGNDSSSSDDEGVMDSHLSSLEGSPVVHDRESDGKSGSDEFCFVQTEKTKGKKVRFAEGPSMVKVHTMVTWDYAYRAARRGPWKTWVCDSERFKRRIGDMETLLKPVLDPLHRAAVYSQRFAHCTETK